MKYFKVFKKLCTPAILYLFINLIIFVIIAIQNFGNTTQYCFGKYRCYVLNTFSIFIFKVFYILFWIFIINEVCKAGYKQLSWFMILLPIILLFIILNAFKLNSSPSRQLEGFDHLLDLAKNNPDKANETCSHFKALNSRNISASSDTALEWVKKKFNLNSIFAAEILSIYIIGLHCQDVF